MMGLGSLVPDHGTVSHSRVHGVSGNGKIVVGEANTGMGITAIIWDAEHGMRSMADYLEHECDLNLSGWNFRQAMAISDDGLTVVGMGSNPYGRPGVWVATIPEPASMSLLALGALAMICRRRK